MKKRASKALGENHLFAEFSQLSISTRFSRKLVLYSDFFIPQVWRLMSVTRIVFRAVFSPSTPFGCIINRVRHEKSVLDNSILNLLDDLC